MRIILSVIIFMASSSNASDENQDSRLINSSTCEQKYNEWTRYYKQYQEYEAELNNSRRMRSIAAIGTLERIKIESDIVILGTRKQAAMNHIHALKNETRKSGCTPSK